MGQAGEVVWEWDKLVRWSGNGTPAGENGTPAGEVVWEWDTSW